MDHRIRPKSSEGPIRLIGFTGVLTLVLIIAAACGDNLSRPTSDVPATPVVEPTVAIAPTESAIEPDVTPSPDPEGGGSQHFAAAAASVEFDVEAFAAINPGGPRDVDPNRFRQLLGRDHIVPIYDPLVVSHEEAGLFSDELVMGVALNGEARAYPVGMMRSREIANDELGGVPLLVTW